MLKDFKMEIEDMSTHTIEKFLEKRKEIENEKDWQDAFIEFLDIKKSSYLKYNSGSTGSCLLKELKVFQELEDGNKTGKIIKALNKYDGYFWFSNKDGKAYITFVIRKGTSYNEVKRFLEEE